MRVEWTGSGCRDSCPTQRSPSPINGVAARSKQRYHASTASSVTSLMRPPLDGDRGEFTQAAEQHDDALTGTGPTPALGTRRCRQCLNHLDEVSMASRCSR